MGKGIQNKKQRNGKSSIWMRCWKENSIFKERGVGNRSCHRGKDKSGPLCKQLSSPVLKGPKYREWVLFQGIIHLQKLVGSLLDDGQIPFDSYDSRIGALSLSMTQLRISASSLFLCRQIFLDLFGRLINLVG